MTILELQNTVDAWINTYGVKYFDEKTNALLLQEEIGEFSRLIARKYGEQSFKREISPEEIDNLIKDEMADMLFVIVCLANQMKIDITSAIKKNLNKKTTRDQKRHYNNNKLERKANDDKPRL